MRFRDFDVLITGGDVADERELNLRPRAFVQAVIVELGSRRTDSPWGKLYVDIGAPGTKTTFMKASPNLGLGSAGVHIPLGDPALLTTTDSAIRLLLARAVAATRGVVRESGGWDDPWFWDLIERTGSREGPYEQRLPPVKDRETSVVYHLTYEWDEDGTRLYADARRRPDDNEPLGRSLVREFPGQWELLAGDVPSEIRPTPDGMELRDRQGLLLERIARPTMSEPA